MGNEPVVFYSVWEYDSGSIHYTLEFRNLKYNWLLSSSGVLTLNNGIHKDFYRCSLGVI